jgi:hypothetical protein
MDGRPTSRAGTAALLAALVLGATAVSPLVSGAGAVDVGALKKTAEKKTIKAVKKKLPRGGGKELAKSKKPVKVKVSSCKERGSERRITSLKCAWNAHGELRGRVPLRCAGTATYDVKKGKVTKGKKCKNREELQAPLLASPHDVLFGYFEDFGSFPDLWDDAVAGGSNIAREGITWRVLQPNEGGAPNSWDWGSFDAIYNAAIANGVRLVFTFRNAPCWAAVAPCKSGPNPPAPEHYDEYAFAAAQIALRYPQLAAIEIWFEPNGVPFWGAQPNPAAFSALVKAAADAVHATGTGIPVWTGGLAPGMASPDKLEYGRFLDQALDAGGIQTADAVAFHAVTDVPFKPGNDPTRGYLGRLRIQIRTLQDTLKAHRSPKPVVLTQLSYSSGPGEYTEAQQAEALVTSYEVARRIANVPAVIVSRLLDIGDGSKVAGFGVLRADRSRKPAYCQLAAARGASPAGC